MHDGVDSFALDYVANGVAVADVALDEGESLVIRERLEVREVPGVRERVERDNRVARMMLCPEMDEVGADESGRPGNKHPTHRDLFPRSFFFPSVVWQSNP